MTFAPMLSPEHLEARHNRDTGDGDCPSAFWASWELRAKEILKDIQPELEAMHERAEELGYSLDVSDLLDRIRDNLMDAPTVPLE